MRPNKLIGILGTHTEVGKTFVTCQWLAHVRSRGLCVAARKPVQSFAVGDTTTDASQLAAITGEHENDVCPSHRRYELALAPPMAADLLQRTRIALADLVSEIRWPVAIDVGVVETVGGPLSPAAHDGDSLDLLSALAVDAVVLVADAGLGTLNAVRLSLHRIADALPNVPIVVYLNRFDVDIELHRLNLAWLRSLNIHAVTIIAELSSALVDRAVAAQEPAT